MSTDSRTLSSLSYVVLLTFALQSSGCAALAIGAAGGAAGGAASSVEQSEAEDHSAMTYVGSVGASALYFPAKVLFAAGGALTSGVAYLVTLGDQAPAQSIWTASVDGDYVVTPRMIEGHDDVDFVGG
ncbi:MAG: hypothetical protein WEF50_04475 [Myxococcota bacterium]